MNETASLGMGDETESGAPRLSGVDLDKLFIDPTR